MGFRSSRRDLVLGVVVAALGRDGHDPGVDDLEHLAAGHVDEGDDSLDGMGVAVVVGRVAHVGQAPADPAPFLVRHAEGPRRPRVDLHRVEVLDAAPAHGRLPLGVLLHGHDGGEATPRTAARAGRRVTSVTVRARRCRGRHRLDDVGVGPGHEHHAARGGRRGRPGPTPAPGRGWARTTRCRRSARVVEAGVGPDQRHRRADLRRAERFRRMGHPGRCLRVGHPCPLWRRGAAPGLRVPMTALVSVRPGRFPARAAGITVRPPCSR